MYNYYDSITDGKQRFLMMDSVNTDFFGDLEKNICYTKPLLKWAGGKQQLLPDILSIIKSVPSISRYIEPFVGGGAIAFNANIRPLLLSDKNHRLITFYQEVKENPEDLYREIRLVWETWCKTDSSDYESLYLKLRDEFNSDSCSGLRLAALMWVLNKTGFNGMYRETQGGKFNIPFGKRGCPAPDYSRFESVHKVLQVGNAELVCGDFSVLCSKASDDDLVYLDPPYIPLSITANFISYTKGGFGEKAHFRLQKKMQEMSNRGVHVIMSNSCSHLTYDIYSHLEGFSFIEVNANRNISASSASRKSVKEVIVTNISS